MKEMEHLAARGELAGGVTAELAEPLARVREMLEAAIELLDGHIARARGPEPLPYPLIGELRERIADAFLDAGRAARLAGDLSTVIGTSEPGTIDVNDVVDRAVTLARHRLDRARVLVDLGTIPPVHGDGSRLAQAIAHLLLPAADTGRVELRTFTEGNDVIVTVAHPGEPSSRFAELVEENVAAQPGRVSTRRVGDKVVHEIRLTFK